MEVKFVAIQLCSYKILQSVTVCEYIHEIRYTPGKIVAKMQNL